ILTIFFYNVNCETTQTKNEPQVLDPNGYVTPATSDIQYTIFRNSVENPGNGKNLNGNNHRITDRSILQSNQKHKPENKPGIIKTNDDGDYNTSGNIIPKYEQDFNISRIIIPKDQQHFNISGIIIPKHEQDYNISGMIMPKYQQDYNISGVIIPKDQEDFNISGMIIPKDQQHFNISGIIIPKHEQDYNISGMIMPKYQQDYNISGVIIPKDQEDFNISGMIIPKGQQDYNTSGIIIPKSTSNDLLNSISLRSNILDNKLDGGPMRCGHIYVLRPGDVRSIRSKKFPKKNRKPYWCKWTLRGATATTQLSLSCPKFYLRKSKKGLCTVDGLSVTKNQRDTQRYCGWNMGPRNECVYHGGELVVRLQSARKSRGMSCKVIATEQVLTSTSAPTC
ncbi:unnamed protein product, partial [Meganyctiphanes norvegica]